MEALEITEILQKIVTQAAAAKGGGMAIIMCVQVNKRWHVICSPLWSRTASHGLYWDYVKYTLDGIRRSAPTTAQLQWTRALKKSDVCSPRKSYAHAVLACWRLYRCIDPFSRCTIYNTALNRLCAFVAAFGTCENIECIPVAYRDAFTSNPAYLSYAIEYKNFYMLSTYHRRLTCHDLQDDHADMAVWICSGQAGNLPAIRSPEEIIELFHRKFYVSVAAIIQWYTITPEIIPLAIVAPVNVVDAVADRLRSQHTIYVNARTLPMGYNSDALRALMTAGCHIIS